MGNVSLNGASGKPGDIPEYVVLHWHRELCQCRPFISPTLVETKCTRLKRTQTRSWHNSRLVKAKISKGSFKIKAFHCFFRLGKTGCRHLNDWTAGQETLWSAEEKALKRKKDEGGNLDGRKTKKEHSAI
jgi:hypothetical protein